MYKSLSVSAAIVLAAVAVAGAAGPDLKTEDQKTLYALGLVISQNLASFNLNASDLESVLAGVSDGVLKKDVKVDVQAYAPKISQLQASRAGATAAVEKKADRPSSIRPRPRRVPPRPPRGSSSRRSSLAPVPRRRPPTR